MDMCKKELFYPIQELEIKFLYFWFISQTSQNQKLPKTIYLLLIVSLWSKEGLSLSNLGILPLEATMLYIEESVANK